jgi:sensor domain CHASE-containing protein
VLALILGMPTAHAEDQAKQGVSRLGEHPAVIVARRGVQVDPTPKFNLHPALSRGLQRPMEDQAKQGVSRLGQHPAVIVARRGVLVDPTSKFNLHPALTRGLQRPMEEMAPIL